MSIIVPVRNEEEHMPYFIRSIASQSLKKNLFELILVNDHSTDQSLHSILNEIRVHSNFRVIDSDSKRGKKNAITEGIKGARGDLIIITDADCTHHKDWLNTIYSFYLEYKPRMIICPVLMHGSRFIGHLQSLDFLSLIASGAGACGINRPIMCNGANLAFEKKVFEELDDPFKQEFASGEDVFLMHRIKKKYPGKIMFLKSFSATATTRAEKNLKLFLTQRKRWASKSKGYSDKDTIFTALIVFLTNCSLFASLILSFFNTKILTVFIIQFLIKSIPDLLLLYQASSFFGQKKLLQFFVPTQIFNVIFIPYIAIAGIIGKSKWKI